MSLAIDASQLDFALDPLYSEIDAIIPSVTALWIVILSVKLLAYRG